MHTEEDLLRLLQLRDSGVLTAEEFEAKTRQVLQRARQESSPGETVRSGVRSVGAYDLLEKVGEGGMGEVYRGRHRVAAMAARQGGDVAVKLVHAHVLSKKDSIERLRREAEALAALDHPHIVNVHDWIEEGGLTAVVMEWVPGRPLSQVIGSETGPIPWERAWGWVRPMLEAVAHAHERGVIHRDLKPENMFVTPEGAIKLLDFGIARLGEARGRTRAGTSMGTVDYMAPEQFLDAGAVDARADVYAAGLTIYAMLAGRLPWEADQGEYEVMRRKERGDVPPPTAYYPEIPSWVVDAVMGALHPDVSKRTPNVRSLAAALTPPGEVSSPQADNVRGALADDRPAQAALLGETIERASVWSAPAAVEAWEEVIEHVSVEETIHQEVVVRPAGWFSREVREIQKHTRPVVQEVRRRFRQGWASPSLGTMRLIPSGTFLMGSSPIEDGRREDERHHEVTLTRAFYLMEYPVTQGQWRAVMGKNPSRFRDRGERCPVDSVSWEDVQKFIEIVSASDRAPYRLPTEAEWEYAARGGERHDVFSGSDKASVVAWHAGNAGGAPQPVGLKPRNGYGLSDMSGNVWEWVSDWYGDYPRHEVIDPTGPETGTRKIYRGGSWYNDARSARVAVRESNVLNYRFDNLGFRLLVPVG